MLTIFFPPPTIKTIKFIALIILFNLISFIVAMANNDNNHINNYKILQQWLTQPQATQYFVQQCEDININNNINNKNSDHCALAKSALNLLSQLGQSWLNNPSQFGLDLITIQSQLVQAEDQPFSNANINLIEQLKLNIIARYTIINLAIRE